MSERIVMVEISTLEAAHLTDLVDQFGALLVAEDGEDPAIARLVPDGYRDDAEAAAEFRGLTQSDLLARRRQDVAVVLGTLTVDGARLRIADLSEIGAELPRAIALDESQAASWLRTLAALRLVLAARLGVTHEDDHEQDDPRFGIYDWLGFRLEGLLQALDD